MFADYLPQAWPAAISISASTGNEFHRALLSLLPIPEQ
jgi:hypothetical protein